MYASTHKISKMALSLVAFLTTSILVAQTDYVLDTGNSSIFISGTSTLHDWESKVDQFEATVNKNDNTLSNVRVVIQVTSIKSGKSGMDANTYNAFRYRQNPTITFICDELTVSGTKVTGTGKLTMNGTTNDIPVDLKLEQWTGASFSVLGNLNLKMTDYNIDPPTAMMGAVKTGNEVSLQLSINMKTI